MTLFDWEQRKFRDIYKKSSEKNDLSYSKDQVISVATMKWSHAPSNSSDTYMKSYNVMKKGDIAFEGHVNKNYIYGRFVENTIGDGIVSHIFDVYTPLEKKHNLNFWKDYISSSKIMNRILRMSTTNARMMSNLVKADIDKQIIYIPSHLEQQQIGDILKTLTKCIDLQQRKLKQLGLIKRALQQQLTSLFSNRNLTFIYQNNDWKNTTLNKILKERKELTTDSKIPLVSLTKEGVVPKNTRYNREFLVKEQNKKYKLTKSNDIVYNPANLKFGVISRNKLGTAKFSPIYVTFNVSNNFDPTYIEIVVTDPDFINYSLRFEEGTVYERKSVKPQDLLSIKIWCPDKFDQFKVAKLYNQVTNDIKYNKLKLKSYYKLKKNLLQTLFI